MELARPPARPALPAESASLTPREVVTELDRYIIGQQDAKRMVAIALRNRWRRQQLADDMRDEVAPKNIIMIGPTGVGKTEIARRLAKLCGSPFLKVEASKYTEVGYVGRDVESMVRDLLMVGIGMVRKEMEQALKARAAAAAEERLLDLLLPKPMVDNSDERQRAQRTREKLRERLKAGGFDDTEVDIDIVEAPQIPLMTMGGQGTDGMDTSGLEDMLGSLMPKRTKTRRVRVPEAREIVLAQQMADLIDEEDVVSRARERVQQGGIIFVDEIDKVASRHGQTHGGDVSREGVQRDILPIVEGTTVATKHGPVDTHHILFIAAGAFHVAKPTDLIPELQGRFPLRVELHTLGADEFRRILEEPDNALTKQYAALLATEGVELHFSTDGIAALADAAARVNDATENIGARRLHTIMEKVLEDVLFNAPDMQGVRVDVDAAMVERCLKDIIEDPDLSRYIL